MQPRVVALPVAVKMPDCGIAHCTNCYCNPQPLSEHLSQRSIFLRSDTPRLEAALKFEAQETADELLDIQKEL